MAGPPFPLLPKVGYLITIFNFSYDRVSSLACLQQGVRQRQHNCTLCMLSKFRIAAAHKLQLSPFSPPPPANLTQACPRSCQTSATYLAQPTNPHSAHACAMLFCLSCRASPALATAGGHFVEVPRSPLGNGLRPSSLFSAPQGTRGTLKVHSADDGDIISISLIVTGKYH